MSWKLETYDGIHPALIALKLVQFCVCRHMFSVGIMRQKKPKVKKPCPLKITEHQHQCKFFDWVRIMRPLDKRFEYIISVPNAGKRSWHMGRAMKAEGLSAGFPDIVILHPSANRKYASAFLELKADYGYVTSIQEDWHERLRLVPCFYMRVCYGSEELIQTTKEYFGYEKEEHSA